MHVTSRLPVMNQPTLAPLRSTARQWASIFGCAFLLAASLCAQDTPIAPADLPGKGLAQHEFFYAGEQKQHQMFIIKHGRVVWSYVDANSKGEISDAVMLSNGNILFAH